MKTHRENHRDEGIETNETGGSPRILGWESLKEEGTQGERVSFGCRVESITIPFLIGVFAYK